MSRRWTSLRARLALLVLAFAILLVAQLAWQAHRDRQQAIRTTEQTNSLIARAVASQARSRLADAGRALELSGRDLAIAPGACQQLADSGLSSSSLFDAAWLVDGTGSPLCRPPSPPATQAALGEVARRTAHGAALAATLLPAARADGEPQLLVAVPVARRSSTQAGGAAVLAARLAPGWFTGATEQITAGTRARVALTGAGARTPGGSVRRSLGDAAAHPSGSVWSGRNRDGSADLLYASTALSDAIPDVHVTAVTPTAVAFRPFRAALIQEAGLAAVVGLAMLLALLYGEQRLVFSRVNRLVDASERISGGDLSARTGLRRSGDAIGELASAFDSMAASLQAQASASDAALAALGRQEAHFRLLAENMTDVVAVHDPAGIYTYLSPSVEEVLGYRPEELVGTNAYDLICPEDVEHVKRETRRQVAEHDGAVRIEYRVRHRNGDTLWFETNKRAAFDDEGALAQLETVSRNVTRRHEVLEALTLSEERFRSLVLHASDMIGVLDAEGRMSYVSPAVETVTGHSVEAIEGANVFELVHPDDLPAIQSAFASLAHQPQVRVRPYRFRTREGSWAWLESIGTNLLEDPAVRGIVVNSRNVTERLEAERERERYTTELERSNRELQEFAYVASHDLQEPLRKIQAFSGRLAKHAGDALDERGADYLDRMQHAATRMRALIEDLLAFSRVTTHARAFVPVDLGHVLSEAQDVLAEPLAETGGRVSVVGALPTIDADPDQMLQLLQNLVANALKYHRPGTPPEVVVRARVRRDDEVGPSAEISFEDNGIGFEEQYAERIFGVFQRLHGRGAYPGNGVGLAICRKIVERHAGSITASGRPDQGATFTVTLPLRHDAPGGTEAV